MSTELIIENEIKIAAPVSKVWDTLVNPKLTPQYMFGCELISDFEIGSDVLWKGTQDGVVYVSGNLVALDFEKQFAYTVIDPNAAYENIPENHLHVVCTLIQEGEGTLLSILQNGYNTVAEGQKRYEETMAQGGWSGVLEGIKKIAEG